MDIVLSVIVCTYNRQDLLLSCLESLAGQTLDRRLYEVVVVNNNSTDGTQQLAQSFASKNANFRVAVEERQGLSHARNCGWREARGEYVAYLDDDARATPQWCQMIVRAFHAVTPRPAAVGGEIQPWYQATPPEWFADAFEIRTWGSKAQFLQPPVARFGFSGSNMAFPKQILQDHGGFSDHFGMLGSQMRMGEETELFSRIYQSEPHFWYDPAITVFHWVPRENMRLAYRFSRSFSCGAANAHIEGRRLGVGNCLNAVLNIGRFLAVALLTLPKPGTGFRKEAAGRLQGLAGRLGYFFGAR